MTKVRLITASGGDNLEEAKDILQHYKVVKNAIVVEMVIFAA
jgi:hypothetical protein